MMHLTTPPIRVEELERMLLNPSVPDSAIRPYLMQDHLRSTPFDPSVRVNPSKVIGPGPAEGVRPQSALVLNSLNASARWRRQQRYRRRLQEGWSGVRIVSEGDSWFQYPFLLEDVVDHLDADYAVFSLDAAGDTLADYLRQDELVAAVLAERPHAVLLSGGGNDLLGSGRLREVVERHRPGASALEHLGEAFERRLAEVLGAYRALLLRLRSAAPTTPVFLHSYDHAIPAAGRWLGRPLAELGIIDPTLQREIVQLIVDSFHASLAAMIRTGTVGSRVTLIDCRGSVAAGGWHDELHPDSRSFALVAEKFRDALRAALQPAHAAMGMPETKPDSSQDPLSAAVIELATSHTDAVLYREIGRRMTLAVSAGASLDVQPAAMAAIVPASSLDGASDGFYLLGRRIVGRLHRELYGLLCGSTKEDEGDRAALREALDLGQGALAAYLAGLLAGGTFGLPATVATVVAALLVKRFFAATWDETCQVWGEDFAPAIGGTSRPSSPRQPAAAMFLQGGRTTMSANERHFCVCMARNDLPAADRETAHGQKAAVLKDSKWLPAEEIRIRFLDGSPALRDRVKGHAEEWIKPGMANLNFRWVEEGDADIRIAFQQGAGSWSYLGTVCRNITNQDEPTMNYGWLTDDSSDEEVRSVVLHEFGHALGLIHEHQNPEGGIVWNEPAVIADLSGPPNRWTIEQIRFNVLDHYDPEAIQASPVDKKSIMMYPIPEAWTVGDFSTGFNDDLTQTDRDIIREAYP